MEVYGVKTVSTCHHINGGVFQLLKEVIYLCFHHLQNLLFVLALLAAFRYFT